MLSHKVLRFERCLLVNSNIKKFSNASRNALNTSSLFVNDPNSPKTVVGRFGDQAILVNKVKCLQSVLCLPTTFLLWEPKTFQDITIESLQIFTLLYPTIELLLIGTGATNSQPLPGDLVAHFRSKGVVIEASATPFAASTFNMLNQEGRNVAAALLTMEPWDSNDQAGGAMRRRKVNM